MTFLSLLAAASFFPVPSGAAGLSAQKIVAEVLERGEDVSLGEEGGPVRVRWNAMGAGISVFAPKQDYDREEGAGQDWECRLERDAAFVLAQWEAFRAQSPCLAPSALFQENLESVYRDLLRATIAERFADYQKASEIHQLGYPGLAGISPRRIRAQLRSLRASYEETFGKEAFREWVRGNEALGRLFGFRGRVLR